MITIDEVTVDFSHFERNKFTIVESPDVGLSYVKAMFKILENQGYGQSKLDQIIEEVHDTYVHPEAMSQGQFKAFVSNPANSIDIFLHHIFAEKIRKEADMERESYYSLVGQIGILVEPKFRSALADIAPTWLIFRNMSSANQGKNQVTELKGVKNRIRLKKVEDSRLGFSLYSDKLIERVIDINYFERLRQVYELDTVDFLLLNDWWINSGVFQAVGEFKSLKTEVTTAFEDLTPSQVESYLRKMYKKNPEKLKRYLVPEYIDRTVLGLTVPLYMRYVVSHETPLFSILRRLRGKTEKRFVLLENSYMQDVHTRVRLSESGEALHDKIVRLEGSEADLKAANEKLRLAYTDLEMMIQRQGHDVGNTMGMLESMSYSIKDLYYDILRMIDDASKAESLDEINEKLTAANRIMEEGRAIVDFFPKRTEYSRRVANAIKLLTGKDYQTIENDSESIDIEALCTEFLRVNIDIENNRAAARSKRSAIPQEIKPITYDVKFESGNYKTKMHKDLVISLMYRLYENSIKYLDPNKEEMKVYINGRDLGNEIEIVFGDTGNGIDDATREKLLGQQRTSTGEGLRLGYLTIWQVINYYGGKLIDINSEKGKGTEVTMRFPKREVETSGNGNIWCI